MEEAPKRRSLIGPLEMIMLIIGLGIIAYVTLQKGGGKVMERTESVKILDQPNGPKERARRYDAQNEESVEVLLRNMAEQFSEEDNAHEKPKTQRSANVAPIEKLSGDEKKYYEDLRRKSSVSEQIESARDWYRVLSASQKTYAKVKEILGEAARQPEDKINPNNVNEELQNKEATSDFYRKLSESFQIAPEDLEAFGRTGKRAISDWAEFVQEKSKN